MTANQPLEFANTQTGHAANVRLGATSDEEHHRRQQTQLDNSSSNPATIDNHQAKAADNQ